MSSTGKRQSRNLLASRGPHMLGQFGTHVGQEAIDTGQELFLRPRALLRLCQVVLASGHQTPTVGL